NAVTRSAISSSRRRRGRRWCRRRGCGWCWRRGGGCRRRCIGGIKPALENTLVQDVRFRIDGALPDQAAEGSLDVGAWAAEAVVKLDVTEGGVQVVHEHQPDGAPAGPYAFRMTRRPADHATGFGQLLGTLFGCLPGRIFLLIRRLLLAVRTLGKGGRDGAGQRGHTGEDGKVTQTGHHHLAC